MYHRDFIDIYGIEKDLLKTPNLLWQLLIDVCSFPMPNHTPDNAMLSLIPCFDQVPASESGYSAVMLDAQRHFTCHTYAERGLAFVDFFCISDRYPQNLSQTPNSCTELLKQQLDHVFHAQTYDHRQGSGTGNYGKHLTLEIPPLDNVMQGVQCVDLIVDRLGMHRLAPMMINYNSSKAPTYDLLQPIVESHVALHQDRQRAFLDVFSCRTFDDSIILDLHPKASNIHSTPRGEHF